MSVQFIERTTGASVVSTELNALADDTAALISTPLSNDASDERDLLADFLIIIAEQAGAGCTFDSSRGQFYLRRYGYACDSGELYCSLR